MRTSLVVTYSDRFLVAKLGWLCMALSLCNVHGAYAQQSRAAVLQQIPWSRANTAELQRVLDSTGAVKSFLNEIGVDGAGPAARAVSEVKEYRFMDLAATGAVELVALVDITGRGLFNNVHIVYRRPGGLIARELHGFGLDGLDKTITDVDGDGLYEIVLPQTISTYEGAGKPAPVIPEVYAWTGNDYEKASARYPAYYRNVVLPVLEGNLKKLDSVPEQGMTPGETAKRQLWREKYQAEIAAVRGRLATKH